MRQIHALVGKDLRVHARAIARHFVAWIFLMRILLQAQHALGFAPNRSLAASMVNTSIALFPIFAIYGAQWLVDGERGRETFAWIRTLPVSDLHIVLAKFAAMLTLSLSLAVGWRIASFGVDMGLAGWQLASLCATWCTLGGIALLCQMLFSGRLAGLVPAFLCFVAGVAGFLISRSPQALLRVQRGWNDPGWHAGLWLACAGIESLAVLAAYGLFRSRDARQLVE